MRRIAFNLATFAICFAAMQGFAQPSPHHHGGPPAPLLNLLGPRTHGHPAEDGSLPPDSEPLDASTVGSPLTLLKGWRVGVTPGAAAAAPDFDDSSWAARDAQDGFPDLPDEGPGSGPDGGPHAGPHGDAGPNGKGVPQPDRDTHHGHGTAFIWFRMHV